jgi:hypothetical protein
MEIHIYGEHARIIDRNCQNGKIVLDEYYDVYACTDDQKNISFTISLPSHEGKVGKMVGNSYDYYEGKVIAIDVNEVSILNKKGCRLVIPNYNIVSYKENSYCKTIKTELDDHEVFTLSYSTTNITWDRDFLITLAETMIDLNIIANVHNKYETPVKGDIIFHCDEKYSIGFESIENHQKIVLLNDKMPFFGELPYLDTSENGERSLKNVLWFKNTINLPNDWISLLSNQIVEKVRVENFNEMNSFIHLQKDSDFIVEVKSTRININTWETNTNIKIEYKGDNFEPQYILCNFPSGLIYRDGDYICSDQNYKLMKIFLKDTITIIDFNHIF